MGMNPYWMVPAALGVLVGGTAVLRNRTRFVQWSFAGTTTLVAAGVFTYWIGRHLSAPLNSPSAAAAVFIVVPMLVTFAIERLWWIVVGGSHPAGTALLSVPLGILAYILSAVVAMSLAMDLGVIWP
jgi:hypothetical protein